MKQGERFSDERVRGIKEALIRGTHPRAIARQEGVNLNTIIRIRDGDTYAGVKVFGEEMLRKSVVFVGLYEPKGEQVRNNVVVPVPEMPQEEIDAQIERIMSGAPTPGKALKLEIPEDLMEQARIFGAVK